MDDAEFWKDQYHTCRKIIDELEAERNYLKKALWLSRAERAKLEIQRESPYVWSLGSCECWEKAVKLFIQKAREIDDGKR